MATLKIVAAFAEYFRRSPDQLGPERIRAYQVYLITEQKLNARTAGHHIPTLRFFFCKTLKRNYRGGGSAVSNGAPTFANHPETGRSTATDRLAINPFHRAMLMMVYSTGIPRVEMCAS